MSDKSNLPWQNKITNIGLIILLVLVALFYNGIYLNGFLKFIFFVPLLFSLPTAGLVLKEEKEIAARIKGNLLPLAIMLSSLGFFI